MPATATRLLVLGVVQIFGPANGYQLRRELVSWGVEAWAHVNPGSIYSMLGTLSKHGLISRHDLPSDGRPITVYQSNEPGATEFRRLVGIAIQEVNWGSPADFRAAMSFASFLTRDRFIAHCVIRLDALRSDIADLGAVLGTDGAGRGRVPPAVGAEIRLERSLRETEAAWLSGLIDDVRAGSLEFDGEPGGEWVPPGDDAGWRMLRERDAYRKQLAQHS